MQVCIGCVKDPHPALPEAGICEMGYISIMQFWVIFLVDKASNQSQLEWCN